MAGSIHLTPDALSVDPGESASCSVLIRNTGTVVDQFQVTVLGDAARYATIVPPVLSLFPDAEGTVEISFQPPRAADVAAGTITFGVKVEPHEAPENTVVEEGRLTVGSFTEVVARVTPRNSEAKRSARHEVTIENRGNATVDTEIEAEDPDEVLAFDIRPQALQVPPNSTGRATVRVAPRRKGRAPAAVNRPFQIRVRPGSQPPVVLDATMTHKPSAPRWIGPVAAVAVAAAALAIVLPAVMSNKPASRSGTGNLASAGATTLPPPPPADDGGGDSDSGGEAPAPAAPTGAPSPAPQPTQATPPPTQAPSAPGVPSRVVFRRTVGATEHVFAVNLDGSDLKQLTKDGARNTTPAWSPDRKRIALARTLQGSLTQIWVMNADGSGLRSLTAPGTFSDLSPAWSPDGARIAFASTRDNGEYDLFVMAADGSNLVNITKSVGVKEADPTWSPDGRQLAYERDGEVWLVNADGSNARKLVSGIQPSWSPHSSLLAFTTGAGTSAEVALVDTARPTDPVVPLTGNDKADLAPAWMADGSRIVFASDRDGQREIYVMDGGGGGQTRLTNGPEIDDVPHI